MAQRTRRLGSWWLRAAIGGVALAALVAVRVALQPPPPQALEVHLTPEQRAQARAALAESALDQRALLARVAARRVVLVGENHFVEEPQTWLCDLLRDLQATDGRRAVLLLELPPRSGRGIQAYLAGGDEAQLAAAFSFHDALPYERIVRWARAHPEAVAAVVADDEDWWRVGLMRLFLSDSRNETMARAVADASRAHPRERVLAYGGRFHMMRGGRYMYDDASRSPAGARLPGHGLARGEAAAVWLFAGDPPLGGAWDSPGAVAFDGPAGRLPIAWFEELPVFGAGQMGEILDAAVYLGPATRIPGR